MDKNRHFMHMKRNFFPLHLKSEMAPVNQRQYMLLVLINIHLYWFVIAIICFFLIQAIMKLINIMELSVYIDHYYGTMGLITLTLIQVVMRDCKIQQFLSKNKTT